jgi:hypothetical protein
MDNIRCGTMRYTDNIIYNVANTHLISKICAELRNKSLFQDLRGKILEIKCEYKLPNFLNIYKNYYSNFKSTISHTKVLSLSLNHR